MSREVRMVPENWQHPKNEEGNYIPLKGRNFEIEDEEWSEGYAKWHDGICKNYAKSGDSWKPIEPSYRNLRYTDYSGARPSPDDYMPNWPDDERTHYMMYESTSEGTPISPAFATPEELAKWLAGTGPSSFADSTASYEAWLRICNGGFAPSAVIKNGVMISGVEALAAEPTRGPLIY